MGDADTVLDIVDRDCGCWSWLWTEKGGFQECRVSVCAVEGGCSVEIDGSRLLWRETS